jgi:TDG/mug DNA glycosylase family protein
LKPVLVQSFAPVANRHAEILILGSMPGRDSLAAGQYYAHPRNLFWRIMAALLRFDPLAPYRERLKALRSERIALWDVMRSCRRSGSLDARIEPDSIQANDFASFFREHHRIGSVFFNGSTAEATYVRSVLPSVTSLELQYTRLPSTSPAHAALSYQQKLAAWRTVLKQLRPSPEVRHAGS